VNTRNQFDDDADYDHYDDYTGYEYDQYGNYDDNRYGDGHYNNGHYGGEQYEDRAYVATQARRDNGDDRTRPRQQGRHGQSGVANPMNHAAPGRSSRRGATTSERSSSNGAAPGRMPRGQRANNSKPNSAGTLGQRLKNSSIIQVIKKFVSAYGWRAYAIPLLTIVTAWVLIDVASSSSSQEQLDTVGRAVATQTAKPTGKEGPDPAKTPFPKLPPTELPAGGNFTLTGDGTYRVVGTPGAQSGEGKKKTFKYVIEVENGVDTAAYGGDDAFATMVDATLTNVKGWTHDKDFRFEHISETSDLKPDLRIQLTSVETTHKNCGTDIAMETSCFSSEGNRVVINESRWVRGATTFQGDLGSYRQYLLNHEVGHGIGYANHEPCGGQGKPAPIMMQQTLSVSNTELYKIDSQEVYKDDGLVCVTNPWPYPQQ
jgi:hypothetical protein